VGSTSYLTSCRPYFIRALYEWMLDNELTPHIIIDTNAPGVGLPAEHLNKDAVVFNISPESVKSLRITNKMLTCNASFSGKAVDIMIPVNAVLRIFAKENGLGMGFAERPDLTIPLFDEKIEFEQEAELKFESQTSEETQEPLKQRGHLRLVKSDKSEDDSSEK